MKRLLALLLLVTMLFSLTSCTKREGDAAIWDLPNKSKTLHSNLAQVQTSKVSQITGEDSENKTLSRFDVWGTDLGSMAEMNGKVYMFGGDTFNSEYSGNWRSNVLFIIEDDKPSDGLTITGAITDKSGKAIELLPSAKRDNAQKTVIPTDIFAVDNTLYSIYMSVKHWGDHGQWTCGFSGLAKSKDEGKTWKMLNNVKWPGDSNFIQTAHFQMGDTMYIWGIPSGRQGGVALMKVKTAEIEDYEAYEYFVGTDDEGNPQWIKGSEGVKQAKIIIRGPVGEISVMYNEYLGNFVMTYLHEGGVGVVMREGVTPWSDWSQEYVLATPSKYPSLYGGYMLPKYVEKKGQTFYFAMSQYFPIYNIMWMKAELPQKLETK